MPLSNAAVSNFVGGELAPVMYGRTDLPTYKRGVARAQNFFVIPQGPGRYRPGTMMVHYTRRNNKAWFIPFQFNDTQAYEIEATDQYFRFYKDNNIITESDLTITGASQGSLCRITIPGHGLSVGDEFFINDVVGMIELNGKSYLVKTVVDANNVDITDIWGDDVDSSGFTAYTSGGVANRIYEILTPYLEEDIPTLQYTQNADTMYIDHEFYEPRKLTRSGHTSWTLARYSRTADPFTAAKNITGITQANPGVITCTAHGRSVDDEVYIDGVVGMTQINGQHYLVNSVPTANTLTLKTLAGTPVNTTSYTAYSSGGKLEHIGNTGYPRAVTFTSDGRLLHAGSAGKPETVWGSKAPSTGTPAYDDFTTGTNATDAVIFTLAPVHGQVNTVEWLSNTDKFIIAGTFGTVRRIYGATEQESITPTSITAKSVNNYGAAAAAPVSLGTTIFYIQRGKQVIRSFEYDYVSDGYLTTDRNLVSDHLTHPGLDKILVQQGKYDTVWALRTDGVLLGLTFKDKEDISGWHRHLLGGSHKNTNNRTRNWGKVLSIGTMDRPTSNEQLWLVVERYIDGKTIRTVEYMADYPVYPDSLDFFTGDKEDDLSRYENYKFEIQKTAVHLDMALTYDGSAAGTEASASVTPSAVTGESITLTASNPVFTSGMVGRQVWKEYDENGEGGGRAEITAFNSTTEVEAKVLSDFDSTDAIPAGEWYLTSANLTGLGHLEGQTVGVIADGGEHNDGTVVNGNLVLDYQASVVHVGLKYTGILKSLNLDMGGVTGSAQTKKRNVPKVAFRFQDSGGVQFGTDIYNLKRILFREGDDLMDRPVPLFSGIKVEHHQDRWEDEKTLFIVQQAPLPCTVLLADVYTDTTDE